MLDFFFYFSSFLYPIFFSLLNFLNSFLSHYSVFFVMLLIFFFPSHLNSHFSSLSSLPFLHQLFSFRFSHNTFLFLSFSSSAPLFFSPSSLLLLRRVFPSFIYASGFVILIFHLPNSASPQKSSSRIFLLTIS